MIHKPSAVTAYADAIAAGYGPSDAHDYADAVFYRQAPLGVTEHANAHPKGASHRWIRDGVWTTCSPCCVWLRFDGLAVEGLA